MTNPASSTHSPDTRFVSVGPPAERPDADFLSLPEVAALSRASVNTLRWWRQSGAGPRFFKIGPRLVATVGNLNTWIEELRHSPGPGTA